MRRARIFVDLAQRWTVACRPMSDAALRVLLAFVDAFSADGGHAVLRARGGLRGYVHVVPPRFDPSKPSGRHVLVERYNGTVGVTARLKDALGAQTRPDARIQADPLGYSAGPNYGRFKWALTHDAILAKWATEHAFADSVAGLLHGLSGSEGESDEGDYG